MTMEVSKIILEQLGGSRFIAMTGAKNFVGGNNSLSFQLPGRSGYAKQNINRVRVTLDPNDAYTMIFFRSRALVLKQIEELTGLYGDQLQSEFTRVTGLYTTLGTMKAGA